MKLPAYSCPLLVLHYNGIHYNYQLLRYLEEHQQITDRQYGFRQDRSAGDLLAYIIHR